MKLSGSGQQEAGRVRRCRKFVNIHGQTIRGNRTRNYSTIMEAFAPETDTFLPNVQIPVPENHYCCLYVDNDLLVLHQNSCIVKFAAGEGGQLVKRSQVASPVVEKWQNSQTVLDKARGLYFINQKGACVCFNMETGAQGPSV